MEQMLNREGCQLWSCVTGAESGLPTLLVNGGPGCDDYLGPVAELIENRCRVVRFEPRGCGRSSHDGNYDLETAMADIGFVLDQYDFEQALLIGHSFGPDLGLAWGLTHPERMLGLIGIAGGRIVNDRTWHDTYKQNLATIGEAQPKAWSADPDVNPTLNAAWKQYITTPDLLARIAKVPFPAAYITASDDIRPNWPIQQLSGLIPNATYTEIKGAAHCIWLTHAEALQRELHAAIEHITRRTSP